MTDIAMNKDVPAPTDATPEPRRRFAGTPQFARFSGLYMIVAFIVVYSVWVPDTFLTTTTLKSLLSEYSLVMIAAIGVLFTLSVQCFDLTVAAMIGFSAVLSAWLTGPQHINVALAILLVVVCGLVVGVVNGFLVVVVGVDSFIATLGMMAVIGAVTVRIANNSYVVGVPHALTVLAAPKPFGIPVVAVYAAILAIGAWAFLEHTPTGRRMYAVGADLEAARLAGVATSKLRFISFLITAVFASIAGILLTSQFKSASPGQGPGYLLPIFAAALLGATQVRPGRVNVPGTIVAILLLAIGIKGLQLAGVDLWITNLFNGAALIVAVAGSELSKKALGARIRRRNAASMGRR